MTLNEKIKDSVQKTTGIRCYEGVPPEGVVGRFAYFFPLRSGAAQRYNEVAIFFMERPVFSPLNPEKATNDCRYLALNWLNGLYAYSGLKFQDILSQNNTRDDFGGFGVGIRLVLVDEARHSGGSGVVDNRNYFRITCGIKNGINIAWRGTYPSIEYRSVGEKDWNDFTESISLLPAEAIEFRLKEGATWTATTNTKRFNITSADSSGFGYAILSGNIMSLVDPTCESTTIPINGCFEALFANCVVQEAGELQLPATTLTEGCYASMFLGCTRLMYAPALPATTLAADCYFTMFMNTDLITAPTLPATTLASRCYYRMFEGCTRPSFTAPALPATTLATECYYGMFQGCTSLATAPELPATTLTESCYRDMFYGCTSLTTAPELPATTLTTSCYDSMFRNCSSLQSITVAFTSWNITNTNNWVNGVAASGTFNCPDGLNIQHGNSHIPNGWRVVKPTMYTVTARSNDAEMGHVSGGGSYAVGDTVTLTATAEEGNEFVNWTVSGSEVSTTNPYTFTVSQNTTVIGNFEEVQSASYLTFTALQDGSSVGWNGTYPNLEYSTDGRTWTAFTEPVSVNTGGTIMFRNNGTAWVASGSSNRFTTPSGKFDLSGNIMSLVDAMVETTTLPVNNCFDRLFVNCSNIYNAGDLELPATTLTNYCYQFMFFGCSSLATAPALPATTLTIYCYNSMFRNCSSLATAPSLPATTLADYCYGSMFLDCKALVTAPALPATTLTIYCYQGMFQGCNALTTAPALPATTLTTSCYDSMFLGCIALVNAPTISATTLANNCCKYMFQGCTSLVNAPALPATTMQPYCYRSMFNGCTSLTTSPVLPATTLANYCYSYMFSNCTALTTAPSTLPATAMGEYSYQNMFEYCTSLTTAPTIAAVTSFARRCFEYMFQGCTSLSSITVGFTGWSDFTHYWVSGVAASGTFTCPSSLPEEYGVSRIPSGWTTQNA